MKTWKTTEADQSGQLSEGLISITSSTINAVSGLFSIIGSIIGCYVAKMTINSLSSALPTVERGLRMAVDGGLSAIAEVTNTAVERRLSLAQATLAMTNLRSNIETIYESAASEGVGDSDDYFVSFQESAETELLEGANDLAEIFEIKENPNEPLIPKSIEDMYG